MFSFFKKKPSAPLSPPHSPEPPAHTPAPPAPLDAAPAAQQQHIEPADPAGPGLPAAGGSWWKTAVGKLTGTPTEAPASPAQSPATVLPTAEPAAPNTPAAPATQAPPLLHITPTQPAAPASPANADNPFVASDPIQAPDTPAPSRQRWIDKLRNGLRKTGSSIAQVFTGSQIDDALYEELEAALLMADAGIKATEFLLQDLKRRVKEAKASDPSRVKGLLADALTELLAPLEKPLVVGQFAPTVMMVVGVNGAGKTTTIGKLTRHLAEAEKTVLLAAADTFRAAAREQLAVWADRNDARASALGKRVEVVSNPGADPAAVAFDAVAAGKARGRDVVIADTAGRLPTQLALMEELRKIKRVIQKADPGAPHEVLLVVDGNTGQNALAQVKAFDEALGLTGLVVTKLDGTAKGGVLAAIALWGRERVRRDVAGLSTRAGPVPVYFIGVGEKLEDLQTFNAREFAQALLS